MTAQPLSILPADSLTIHLTRVDVSDEDSCAHAMETYAQAKHALKAIEAREDAELLPVERERAFIKARYKATKQGLKELADYEKAQVADYTAAKADFSASEDAPAKASSVSAEVVNRKVNKVRILNKEKVPEQFKIVDEDKILEAYERLGTVPLGISADGSFEVYEETITTLRRKY